MPGSNASPGLAAGTPAPAATAKKKAPRGASWQISEGIIALYSAIHANQLVEGSQDERFKAVWRLSHPDVVNHGGQNATDWLMRYQNPRS